MKILVDTTQEQQHSISPKMVSESSNGGMAQLVDNRSSIAVQRKLQDSLSASGEESANPIQRKTNKTGLPDNLKSGIENLSGYSMDDVKVHYNSSKPAQLQAHAYAQGSDIHLASGQEKHLPHEAWHVVQQKQGRVKPTKQLKSKVNINDDTGLEKEADVMGEKALQMKVESSQVNLSNNGSRGAISQMKSGRNPGHKPYISGENQPVQRQLSKMDVGVAIQELRILVITAQQEFEKEFDNDEKYSFIPFREIYDRIKTDEMRDAFNAYITGVALDDPKNSYLQSVITPVLNSLFGKPTLDKAKQDVGVNAGANANNNWYNGPGNFGLRFRPRGVAWNVRKRVSTEYKDMRSKKYAENKATASGLPDERKKDNIVNAKMHEWFREWVESGSNEMTSLNVTSGTCFYKLMPVGDNFTKSPSPYYLSQAVLDDLKMNGDILNRLGLPLFSMSHAYALYKIQALQNTTIYTSIVAPVDQRIGGYTSNNGVKHRWKGDGGVTQSIISDSNNPAVWRKFTEVLEVIDPDEASIRTIKGHDTKQGVGGNPPDRRFTMDSNI